MSIEIITADITTLAVDAIVNAANQSLLGGGGVDGAIHRAAGPELLQTTRTLGGCPAGEARITAGFNLPAKWVIHTVGPVWQGGQNDETEILGNAYRNVFKLALQNKIRSIAFPAISTGVYGFPKVEAAKVALGEFKRHEDKLDKIIACCFSDEDADIYRKIIRSF